MAEPVAPPVPPDGEARGDVLVGWLREHGARYTPEALARAARDAGYSEEEIETAIARARGAEPARATRERAAWVVAGLYLAAFLVLTVPTRMSQTTYGFGPMILAVALGLPALIFFIGIRRGRSRPKAGLAGFTALLAGPVIVLLVVVGTCIWTVPPIFSGN